MKKQPLFIVLIFVYLLYACKSIDIDPKNIVGKWNPNYEVQYFDGNTWKDWQKLDKTKDSSIYLPTYEFTSDGRFLLDGKNNGLCCFAGDSYKVSENTISFTNVQICKVYCLPVCTAWTILELTDKSVIFEYCSVRYKFTKQK